MFTLICPSHGCACNERTVSKVDSSNYGRRFFSCKKRDCPLFLWLQDTEKLFSGQEEVTIPTCPQHKEPAALFSVKKEGPTKGKTFFTCNRRKNDGQCRFFLFTDKWTSAAMKQLLPKKETPTSSAQRSASSSPSSLFASLSLETSGLVTDSEKENTPPNQPAKKTFSEQEDRRKETSRRPLTNVKSNSSADEKATMTTDRQPQRRQATLLSVSSRSSSNGVQTVFADPTAVPRIRLTDPQSLLSSLETVPTFDKKEVDAFYQSIVPYLKLELLEHQKEGVLFLQNCEESASRGGILGDGMGLGKTFQCLSLLATDFRQDYQRGPTLIICPVSVLAQWEVESRRLLRGPSPDKSKDTLLLTKYHGPSRSSISETQLLESHIVLSSYSTIESEFRLKKGEKKSNVFSLNWFRVILDEAHTIKNSRTSTAKAVSLLTAERRWTVTGTLLQNSIEDVYSICHFLRVPHLKEEKYFRDNILKTGEAGLHRIQGVLSKLMLRRTKETTKQDGSRLLQLPEKKIIVEKVGMSAEEQQLYSRLRAASSHLAKIYRGDASTKNGLQQRARLLVLLLRQRQMCCSSELVRSFIDEMEDEVNEWEKQRKQPLSSEGDRTKENGGLFEKKAPVDSLRAALAKLSVHTSTKQSQSSGCPVINAKLDDESLEKKNGEAKSTSTAYTPNCQEQAATLLSSKAEETQPKINDSSFSKSDRVNCCDLCGNRESEYQTVSLGVCCVHTLCSSCQPIAMRSNVKAQTCSICGDRPSTETTCSEDICSSKVAALLRHIREISNTKKGEKVVVFSYFQQWTSFLRIIKRCLDAEGIASLTLDGTLSASEKAEVISRFEEDNRYSVMLLSLKAGAVGLNLTVANHLFMMDPWWNPAIEDQAYDRVHRIGQTKPVTVVRLIAKNTIEEKLITLQEKKRRLFEAVARAGCSTVVNEGHNEKAKLSMRDIDDLLA